jgi:glutamine synthetase
MPPPGHRPRTPQVNMPPSRSTSEADAFLAAHPDAETVDMVIADMNGILRGKQLARNYLNKLYSDGVRLPGSNYLLDWTGQNVATLRFGTADGDPDYFCFPVKGTLKPVPWSPRPAGQVLASMYHEDGTAYFADPRHILARAMRPLAELGLTPVVAIEYEFYLIDQKAAAEGVVRPAASPQSGWRGTTTSVYALDDLYDFEDLLGDIHAACAVQAIPAETFVKEYAPGQFEINLHHVADPLQACDQAILLERAIKQVARRHGVIATFMAKPFAERVGSGLHVHVSLVDRDGRNVFRRPARPQDPAPDQRHAAPCHRRTTRHHAGSHGDLCAQRQLLPAAEAGHLCAREGPMGRRQPHRAAAHPERRARRGAHRAPGRRRRRQPVSGRRHGARRHSPRHRQCHRAARPRRSATAMPRTAAWHCRSAGRWHCSSLPTGEVLKPYLGEDWCEAFHTARSFEAENHHFTIPSLDFEWYLRTA